jgi:predicted transcriptional regulator of viral defense system
MESKRKGLGKTGSMLLSTLSSSGLDIFTIKDAEKVSRIKGNRLRKLIHDLIKNKWIERIERGKYMLLPLVAGPRSIHGKHPFLISGKLVSPYYIGFFSALNYYGITEQISKITYVVTTKKKKPLEFQGQKYHFVAFPKKRFFGFKKEWMGNTQFKISDKEKTIVDCLYMPEYGGGIFETVKAFREKMDYEKMLDYAIRMDDLAIVKRLGYLLDLLELSRPVADKLLKRVAGGYCLLDTTGPKKGNLNKKWRVIENIKKEELLLEL